VSQSHLDTVLIFLKSNEGFLLHYANELVEFVKSQYNHHFHIEIAAYPEMHPESKN
jgi:5,10-methylenetetrahydrofolate reductase